MKFDKFVKLYLESSKGKQGYYKGNIDLSNLYLFELPDFLKDLIVTGYFDCSYNELTSLEGSPKEVKGDFWCNDNQLTSLEGSPKEIGGHFNCSNNAVEFTEEYVRSLCDVKGEVFVV